MTEFCSVQPPPQSIVFHFKTVPIGWMESGRGVREIFSGFSIRFAKHLNMRKKNTFDSLIVYFHVGKIIYSCHSFKRSLSRCCARIIFQRDWRALGNTAGKCLRMRRNWLRVLVVEVVEGSQWRQNALVFSCYFSQISSGLSNVNQKR